MTPMMQQYRQMKEQTPDCLLLFRMGDFYELFFDDAVVASKTLGLTLTSRDKGPNAIPMAGFPYPALDGYLAKLMQAGVKAAVCEQIEDPKLAKGLVKRDITRIVTPGTLTDEALLDPRSRHFLAALWLPTRSEEVGLAWVDVSAGKLVVGSAPTAAIAEELRRLEPVEVLTAETNTIPPDWLSFANGPTQTRRPVWNFTHDNALDLLRRHFGVATFTGFGIADDHIGLAAAGAVLAYLLETQRTELRHLSRLVPYHRKQVMVLDGVTRRSLELTRTLRENKREGSLLDVLDRTVTAAGARRLADWFSEPLVDLQAIRRRQSAVAEWKENTGTRAELRTLLKEVYDVERLVARISTGRTHPRDLAALRTSLRQIPPIKALLGGRHALVNVDLEAAIDPFPDLTATLERMLTEAPPMTVRDGGIINAGIHPDLDELRDIAAGGKQWLARFQADEVARTGITNLKVGFNKVFGYYLEITNASRDKVPPEYIRKQTIKNAERYVTPELKTHEEKVLGAEERAKNLEYELFLELRDLAAQQIVPLQRLADSLAELDALLSLAELAAERNYVRPDLVDGDELTIEGGRHPVLDLTMPAGRFVPNDTRLGSSDRVLLQLITGPNMAGKSTYIRQTALIVLLAQIGSFVPADAATIGVVDRIFTRVGASDELSRGQSTFMVEMTETANILHNATAQSLVILDEIGRGTSTYDGVSLAWAIAEHLHDKVGCRTLFATHYHELIELEKTLPGLKNANIAVREWQDSIIFLHQIVPGGADRSYGIHVAKLAGVPDEVLKRAQDILEKLERDPFGEHQPTARPKKHRRQAYYQLSLFPTNTTHPILEEIRFLDADLTSEQALQRLHDWRRRVAEE